MTEVLLIRAAQATPFIETSRRLGAPVSKFARQAGLPLSEVQKKEGVIGERSLWDFIELVSKQPGFSLFGYQTALDHPVDATAILGGMSVRHGENLKTLLESFISGVKTESSGADYSLSLRGGKPWFIRQPVFQDSGARWQAELYVISFMIQTIRLCSSGDWLPQEIHVCAISPGDRIPPEWNGIKLIEAKETRIKLSNELLSLPPKYGDDTEQSETARKWGSNAPLQFVDLVDRQIWSNTVGMEQAAAEVGMSPTTLKRRLGTMGTTYRKLLLERRITHASRLLTSSGMRVAEIAKAMGYTSVSNFSRAFTQATGKSPSDYRSAKSSNPLVC